MKHTVDIETWERRDNYAFFRNFLNSWISVATEIDCTEARAAAKAAGRSFFLYYLYAVLRAVNEIREFRYRTDSRGNVIWHDTVDVISPIAVPGRTFYTVRIPYHADFERFYAEARAIVTDIPQDGDPDGAEKVLQAQGDYDVFLLSATPDLYFTSLTYAQGAPGQPTEYPLMNAGKAVMREGRLVMPLSIFVNHAFVDGAHIRILLLTFLFRYMRPLIEHGHVYSAMPPLYKASVKGKEDVYLYSEEEKTAYDAANNNKVEYQRYKGLGEMSTEQLWDTTMNPATRTLVRVSMRDAMEADKMFTILMGESPALRRQFIEQNATLVKDLDI